MSKGLIGVLVTAIIVILALLIVNFTNQDSSPAETNSEVSEIRNSDISETESDAELEQELNRIENMENLELNEEIE